MAKKLTPRERLFVDEYCVDQNATQAVLRAQFTTNEESARSLGYRLFTKAHVKAAIESRLAARSTRYELEADEFLRELRRIAVADVGQAFDADGKLLPLKEMPDDVRRAISSVEVDVQKNYLNLDDEGQPKELGRIEKVKFWNKNDALNTGLKILGKLREKVEHTGDIIVEIRKASDHED